MPRPQQVIERQRHTKVNMTSLVYHTIREQFGGRKGCTAQELSDYLTSQGIEHSLPSLRIALRTLAGKVPHASNRNELTFKYLKKDRMKIEGLKITRNVSRYYWNPTGTVRVRPIEGNGTYSSENLNRTTVNRLSRITNTNVSLEKF